MRITHPFHILYGREYELVEITDAWGERRASYLDEQDILRFIPVQWTDLAALDPEVELSAGEVHFLKTDLLDLSALLEQLKERPGGDEDV